VPTLDTKYRPTTRNPTTSRDELNDCGGPDQAVAAGPDQADPDQLAGVGNEKLDQVGMELHLKLRLNLLVILLVILLLGMLLPTTTINTVLPIPIMDGTIKTAINATNMAINIEARSIQLFL